MRHRAPASNKDVFNKSRRKAETKNANLICINKSYTCVRCTHWVDVASIFWFSTSRKREKETHSCVCLCLWFLLNSCVQIIHTRVHVNCVCERRNNFISSFEYVSNYVVFQVSSNPTPCVFLLPQHTSKRYFLIALFFFFHSSESIHFIHIILFVVSERAREMIINEEKRNV